MKTSKRPRRTGRIIKSAAGHPASDFKAVLFEDLKDRHYAAGYLTAALEEGEDVFLLAVRDVVQAQGGMRSLSQATKLNRENLYGMLSKKGNPRLSSVTAILRKLGFDLVFTAKMPGTTAA
jgi:probable addiction module antidote protein